MLRPLTLALVALATLVCACSGTPQGDPAKPHHTDAGFRNRYLHAEKPSFWKWQWRRLIEGTPSSPERGYGFPVVKPDVRYLAGNRSAPTLTWFGHDTFLLQLGGQNLLTDPHFSERASPVSFAGPQRHTPSPMAISDLPAIDLVIISHNHYDHLDLETVKRLNAQAGGPPLFMVPLGLKQWFADQGVTHVKELDWWEQIAHKGLMLHLTPVQHWSKRTLWDTNATLWGSWVIEHPALRVFFGGDFGYSQDIADIARRFEGFDLALLPIGAYEPRWFMSLMHINPEEAVKVHQELRVRHSIGMHWGTFRLTDELLDEPPRKLSQALARAGLSDKDFSIMKHGETRALDDLIRRP